MLRLCGSGNWWMKRAWRTGGMLTTGKNKIPQIYGGQSGSGTAFSPDSSVSTNNYHSTNVPHSSTCHPGMGKFSHQWSRFHRDSFNPTREKLAYSRENTSVNGIAWCCFARFFSIHKFSVAPINSITSVQHNFTGKKSYFPKQSYMFRHLVNYHQAVCINMWKEDFMQLLQFSLIFSPVWPHTLHYYYQISYTVVYCTVANSLNIKYL
jgi:hypothetical protein